jgi:hypothetical protein
MASTCERRSVTYRIFICASSARRAVVLGRIDTRLAGSFDVDLRGVSGRRTRHSGDANRRYNRGHNRLSRAGMACDRRSHDSVAGRDRPDHIWVRVDSIGSFRKMGVTHSPFFFCTTRSHRVDIRQIIRSIDKI